MSAFSYLAKGIKNKHSPHSSTMIVKKRKKSTTTNWTWAVYKSQARKQNGILSNYFKFWKTKEEILSLSRVISHISSFLLHAMRTTVNIPLVTISSSMTLLIDLTTVKGMYLELPIFTSVIVYVTYIAAHKTHLPVFFFGIKIR